MVQQAVACSLLALLLVAPAAYAQNSRKGQPIIIKPSQVYKMVWKPAPPHPDVVMCCGGALQLSWSPMDSGVVASVVLNVDNSCPNSLQNQEYVKYLFQAQPKGLVTLDFKQNGDYYISCAVAEHCSEQGMQFLLAVRGCAQDNSIYTPVIPLNVPCQQMAQQSMAALNSTMGGAGALGGARGAGAGGLSGLAGLSDAPANQQQQGRRRNSAGAAAGSVLSAAAAALGGFAAAALL